MTNRQWEAETVPNDEFLMPSGGVMEVLSEHQWLSPHRAARPVQQL
ncbi:Xylulose-5-phosphate phosphoketolase [Fimbriiglobus ruber]|uniref:Xylulose-5-phosphate phosphoketolase n=1 Tax=Fimbriiglobus ruber TaxID=1908690 RepID=A0A225DAJ7_9BACT|nr:Xylulose-5-phosphate phosphoketolase [Fimbriiglobus ruber]